MGGAVIVGSGVSDELLEKIAAQLQLNTYGNASNSADGFRAGELRIREDRRPASVEHLRQCEQQCRWFPRWRAPHSQAGQLSRRNWRFGRWPSAQLLGCPGAQLRRLVRH